MQVAQRSFEQAAEEEGSLEVLGCCLTAASGGALLSGAPRSPPPTRQLRPPSGTRTLWLFSHAAEQKVRVPGTRACSFLKGFYKCFERCLGMDIHL